MKAYNEKLLKNEWVQELSREWARQGVLPKENETAIQEAYAVVPYRPHWFVWIGLFVFSCICITAGGILFLPFVDIPGAENFFPPLYGVVLFFFLNYLIRERRLHFSGIDNAFLYAIILCFITPVLQITDLLGDSPWLFALCYLPLLVLAAYWYGEPVVVVSTFFNGLFLLFSVLVEFSWGVLLLPFCVMAYGGIVWLGVHRFLKTDESFYWQTGLRWLRVGCLVVVYLAGNYGMVREGNAALNNLSGNSPEIAFAPLFWFLMFFLPILYVYAAIQMRSVAILTVGSICAVASLATWHHYHPWLPYEWALTLLGAVAIGTALYLMKYLKEPRAGLVYRPEESTELGVLVGNIVSTQLAGNLPDQPQGTPLGGGDFGGGGSGDTY
jgi:hypothetical protein